MNDIDAKLLQALSKVSKTLDNTSNLLLFLGLLSCSFIKKLEDKGVLDHKDVVDVFLETYKQLTPEARKLIVEKVREIYGDYLKGME